MSDTSENEANEEPLTKPKIKKPRSQAQIEAFEKVKERRKQNLEVKKQEKLLQSAKLLVENNVAVAPRATKKSNSSVREKVEYQKVTQDEPIESESEEEVVIIKKAPKKQKKVRKIIIEDSSSEEESDEDYRRGSNSKRYHSQSHIIRPNPNDIFC